MKNSFGGIFTFAIISVILVVLISFIAISMNYARAFRIKNQLLTYIEQYEDFNGTVQGLMNNYMRNKGMTNSDLICDGNGDCKLGTTTVYSVIKNDASKTYTVFVQVNWSIPFITNGTWTISGETEKIQHF